MASRNPGLRRVVVVKVGSSTLVDGDGCARTDVFARLAGECAGLQADGAPVVLVSSGAVALGVGELDGRARRRLRGRARRPPARQRPPHDAPSVARGVDEMHSDRGR